MQKIKLIWDFYGENSVKTAQHHEIHLKEYVKIERINLNISGYQELNQLHSIAFMVVEKENMIQVRDALKPHRGEVYSE
ncbi:hypothetical protein OX283_006835 [Flavobacterium sp. SUN052]|uniref:hypothetical protein n=1 Tax=Flavobacterium sp. SUN052 TaxID=3002441 RepID=UPI00237E98B7|nr:hypothetical protein [Flavobacterium sp. SUN052]MEC4004364.1 hypothetical protein [Flavobacterium sp. SUN052]